MGNSQGVLIAKPTLAQVGLEGTADLQVRDGVVEIRPLHRSNPREGWANEAQRLAQHKDDVGLAGAASVGSPMQHGVR